MRRYLNLLIGLAFAVRSLLPVGFMLAASPVADGMPQIVICTGHGPQNMATLRSVAMNFLRRMGSSIADARRQLALAPHTAPLDLFGIPCDLHIHA